MTKELQFFGRSLAIVGNFCKLKSTAKKTATIDPRSASGSSTDPSVDVAVRIDPLLGIAACGDPRSAAAAIQKMAKLEHAQKRYNEAESLYRRALAIRQQVLGPEHPKVASTLYNLGRLCSEQGCWAEAELLFLESLAIVQEVFGPGHPKVTKRLSKLAELYEGEGRHFFEAAKVRDQLPGDSGLPLKSELVGDEI